MRNSNFLIYHGLETTDYFINRLNKMTGLYKIQKVLEKSDKWYNLKSEIEKTDKVIDGLIYRLCNISEKERKIIEKV